MILFIKNHYLWDGEIQSDIDDDKKKEQIERSDNEHRLL